MLSGNVNLKLRPLKLGFLVNPANKKDILRAIEISSFLWGGQHNPIIPVFRRKPKNWGDNFEKKYKNKDIIEGYVDAYDPDYLVPISKNIPSGLNYGNRKLIKPNEILSIIEKQGIEGTVRYGVGLFQILDYLVEKEFKYVRRDPVKITFPELSANYKPFLASVAGILPPKINKTLVDVYTETFDADLRKYNISQYADLIANGGLFFRRLSQLYLKNIPAPHNYKSECAFFLDASNGLDIIDYWNLRAIGWNVVPVPKQAFNEDSTKNLIKDFVDNSYRPYDHNPNMYHQAHFYKSRNLDEKDVRDFIETLDIEKPPKGQDSKIVHCFHYPRIWHKQYRPWDHAMCSTLEGATDEKDLKDGPLELNLNVLAPKFMRKYGYSHDPIFANEIFIRTYGENELLAEVIPEASDELSSAIGAFGSLNEWRFSKRGIVFIAKTPSDNIRMTIPKAENIFIKWLKSQKWECELSPPGRIANRILKQLGGKYGLRTLASEGLIKLIGEMAQKEKLVEKEIIIKDKSKNETAMMKEMNKISRSGKNGADLLKRLTEVKMFSLGLEIQCPVCQQRAWYKIKDLDDSLNCTNCSENFDLPIHNPSKEMQWSFRTVGAFRLPQFAYGAYSVLLALRFFTQVGHNSATPIMSFNAKKDSIDMEADLALFHQGIWGRNDADVQELIFCECKTYNEFEKKDVTRMEAISKNFPGAILAFVTLRNKLKASEKKLLSKLAYKGRKSSKNGKTNNPVLVLTGVELFGDMQPPYCWKDLKGKHKEIADKNNRLFGVKKLSDFTQQIYLGMESYDEWLSKEFAKRKKRRFKK